MTRRREITSRNDDPEALKDLVEDCVPTLATALAALHHARTEVQVWRLMAKQAVHVLHDNVTETGKLRSAYHRLLDERRSRTSRRTAAS